MNDVAERIGRVDLVGWQGLPPGLAPWKLFAGLERDLSLWAQRRLGEDYEHALFALVELPGYYRPTLSVRDGELILFDGMNPQLPSGLPPLLEDLGEPAERIDYRSGTLPVSAGEWVFPHRGITLFLNTDGDRALHVALYAPTGVEEYRRHLRPHLGKTMRPSRTGPFD